MGQTDVTPDRKTHLRFDVPEYTVAEPAFEHFRQGNEIHDAPGSQNVELLGTGGWALRNIPSHETTAAQSTILPKSSFNTIAAIQEEKHFRQQPELSGITYDPTAASSGDLWLAKRPTASGTGSNWADTLTADVTALPSPVETSIVPLPRIMVYSGNPHPVNQGYEVGIQATGSEINRPDVIARILIGGQQSLGGVVYGGIFCLTFYGHGGMTVREAYYSSSGSFLGYSSPLALWQFATPGYAMGHTHKIRIMPMRTPRGPAIEIRSTLSDTPAPSLLTRFFADNSSHAPLVFYLPKKAAISTSSPAPRGPDATGPSVPRVEARADLAPSFQIATLTYPASGTLVDYPFVVPMYVTVRNGFVLSWQANLPVGTSVDGNLYDATTNTLLTPVSSGPNWKSYQANSGVSHYFAAFTLSSDAAHGQTPILWSYQVTRNGWFLPTLVTEFTGGVLRDYSISGPEADPSHETATINIDDLKAILPVLNARASIRVQVNDEFDPNGATKRVVLFDGYAQRNTGTQRGMAGSTYPSANWKHYDGMWMGMWVRLREALAPGRVNLGKDPNAPNADTTDIPFKVTDIVRTFLSYAGFTPSQIDVPNSEVRFFPTSNPMDAIVQPLANVADLIVKWLRDYLGWWLVWDGNAQGGMWRARPPAFSPYRNLASFITAAPSGKLPHRPESYGSPNWTGTDASPVSTFIRKGTLQTYVKPPEANSVTVIGAGDQLPDSNEEKQFVSFIPNYLSYDPYADGSGTAIRTADPTFPDYLGRHVPLIIVDPTLASQDATDWICRRYFDFTCHAIKMCTFEAPLVFVNDTQDLVGDPYHPNYGQSAIASGYFRPLRYYDPVLINGSQWLVRNCNPFLVRGRDMAQMARFECEAPNI